MKPESPRRAAAPQSLPNPVGYQAITADHPSLAGHFPGHPIVPGVVILVLALAGRKAGLVRLPKVRRAKAETG